MRLFLVRHGQTPSNVLRALDTGRPGPGLTELGQEQARALVERLAEEHLDAVYASPLLRAQLTAGPLSQSRNLQARVLEGLEEIGAGVLEMLNDDDSCASYGAHVIAWGRGDAASRIDGAEDSATFFTRFDAAVEEMARTHGPESTVVAVSHGAAIRCWTAARVAHEGVFDVRQPLANTGIVALEGLPGSWRLHGLL
ncbi:histidine phosphatase family protein [Arthrobacter sp. RAF14]|uniref:histidine phosphatase family protein n=1 Tax=Arthrobacter sp. RAF14 TaxID=3233051 RepID=UPI003F93E32A